MDICEPDYAATTDTIERISKQILCVGKNDIPSAVGDSTSLECKSCK
jgi:hypothetical protein